MAPKDAGGAGNRTAQNYVSDLWQQGLSEQDIRNRLKTDGYKAGRISQLLKATRPPDGQEGADAPPAGDGPARPLKRPAAASGAQPVLDPEARQVSGKMFSVHQNADISSRRRRKQQRGP